MNKAVRLKMISFRVDDETMAAIEHLAAALSGGVVDRRRRSIAIRRAILNEASRVKKLSWETK